MNKTEVSVEDAIIDIREIFGLNRETKSMQKDNRFMIIKTEFERHEVISKLHEYFEDKVLPAGWGFQQTELTWHDIAKIDDMLREVESCIACSDLPTMGREEYYTEVLKRYNELKNNERN